MRLWSRLRLIRNALRELPAIRRAVDHAAASFFVTPEQAQKFHRLITRIRWGLLCAIFRPRLIRFSEKP